MNEGDARASCALANPGFDHFHSAAFGPQERLVEIGRREADVMNAGSATGEMPGYGRVVVRWFKEFNPASGVAEKHNADLLRWNFVSSGRVSSE